jgi:acyl-CoA thioester hydrolase
MYSLLHYRIPFSEVDAMSIVHHSNHARYFERGRVDQLRLIELPYQEVMKRGMHFPLVSMSVDFKRPLAFDSIIVVETKIVLVTKTRLNYSYRILQADSFGADRLSQTPLDGKALVTGATEHCCVDDTGRPQKMAEDVYARLKLHLVELPQ